MEAASKKIRLHTNPPVARPDGTPLHNEASPGLVSLLETNPCKREATLASEDLDYHIIRHMH